MKKTILYVATVALLIMLLPVTSCFAQEKETSETAPVVTVLSEAAPEQEESKGASWYVYLPVIVFAGYPLYFYLKRNFKKK